MPSVTKKMENDRIQSAQATNRDVSKAPPSFCQDCSDIVNISIFFDGTGNNKDADAEEKKWSNPARLWLAASNHPNPLQTNYPLYISGVGTPFNGTAADWIDKARIIAQDKVLGGTTGAGGTRRTNFGHDSVNDTLRQVLFNNAKRLNVITKGYIDKSKNKSLGELSQALRAHRLIKVINLSVFGFSRGAALARAFTNDILDACEINSEGVHLYAGYPIRIHFLGLFDTVASFGVPAANMNGLFTEKNLRVSKYIERCVHYVAGHELRFSFPVDLICQKGKLQSGWSELVYPGVHSDVGGGYEPESQKITNNYARIPMRDMMDEAVKSGVRMIRFDDMKNNPAQRNIFQERFMIKQQTQDAYNDYMASISAGRNIQETVNAHMEALYAAYGTMTRRGIATPDQVTAKDSVGHVLIGHVGMAREAEALLHTGSAIKLMSKQAGKAITMGTVAPIAVIPQGVQFLGTVYGQIVRPEPWRLDAWNQTASDAVIAFVRQAVHDSKVGFIMSAEPFSYFRPRGMAESSHNVLKQGLQWLDETATAVKHCVIKIYHRAEGVVVETWQQGKLVATKTYRVGEKFVIETVQAGEKYAVEVYQSGKEVIITTMAAGQRMLVSSIDTMQKKASSMRDSAQKTATEMAQQAGKSVRQLSDTISETVDDGMKTIEQGWLSAKSALGL